MKKHYEYGDNFIRFEKICAVKACVTSRGDLQTTDSVVLLLEGGHEIPIPTIYTAAFLKEYREYISSLSCLPSV